LQRKTRVFLFFDIVHEFLFLILFDCFLLVFNICHSSFPQGKYGILLQLSSAHEKSPEARSLKSV